MIVKTYLSLMVQLKKSDSFLIYLSKLNYVFNKKLKFVGQIQIIKNKKKHYILTLANLQYMNIQKIISQDHFLSNIFMKVTK